MELFKNTINKNIFPSESKWFNFLISHQLLNHQSVKFERNSILYKNSRGIVNTLTFPTTNTDKDPCSVIDQIYKFSSLLSIHTKLFEDYLNIELKLSPQSISPKVNFISIISQSSLVPVLKEGTIIESLGDEESRKLAIDRYEWKNKQVIFLHLEDNYLKKLKKEKIIPDIFSNKIWITPDTSTGELTIESEKSLEPSKNENKTVLKESLLQRFSEDLGFYFDIKFNEKVTTGKLGNIYFSVGHTDPFSIDMENVWKKITGGNLENPFIFPINVRHC